MSQEQDSSQSKTEKPTTKKLRDLRKKGQISTSKDLTSSVSTTVVVIGSMFFLPDAFKKLSAMMNKLFDFYTLDIGSSQAIVKTEQALFLDACFVFMPLIIIAIAASALTGGLQAGGLLAFDQVAPKLSHINPAEGIKKIFCVRNLVEFLKLLTKALILALIVYLLIRQMLPMLINARFLSVANLFQLAKIVISTLLWAAILVFLVVALFDVWFQRWDFIRKNKMSKEEVRKELKETEGDPHIKSKRRQLQRELSMHQMLENVRKAKVVVINPTHIAVALYYEQDETDLPVVLAKGEGFVAQAIRDIAQEERIPILQDIKLARQLQAKVPIEQYIPEELIEPVAAVMRWVNDLRYVSEEQ